MGEVYGAIDPALDRRVAIKLVQRCRSGEPFRYAKRLQREALALARLSHPNIVGIYDFGSTKAGAYVVMEFVKGLNLRQWLDQDSPPADRVLEVLLAAGRGLAAAHSEGIVHRDFKPSNVMVAVDGSVKVLDFGLAMGTPARDSWVDDQPQESALTRKLTKADVILGTTGYMPPEQLLGRPVDARTDQFAFCVTLFEALYGVRPFPGRNPVELAASYAAQRRSEVDAEPNIPHRVRRVLERGLSLEPDERFPSMQVLLDALDRPRRPWGRWAAATAALVGTACASATIAIWLTRSDAQAPVCEEPSPSVSAASVVNP